MGNFSHFGHERANPCACPTNNIRLEKCDCTQRPVCKDSGIGSIEGKKVTGFTYTMGDTVVTESFNAIDVSTSAGLNLLRDKLVDVVRQYEADPTKTILNLDWSNQ